MKRFRRVGLIMMLSGSLACCGLSLIQQAKEPLSKYDNSYESDVVEQLPDEYYPCVAQVSQGDAEEVTMDAHGLTEFVKKYLSEDTGKNQQVTVAILDTQEVEDSTTATHGSMLERLIRDQTVGGNVEVIQVPIYDDNGDTDEERIAEAINQAVSLGADVINLSVEGKGNSTLVQEAIISAYRNSCFVVAAAGNSGINTREVMPANMACAFVVGAGDAYGEPSDYGNHGIELGIVAYDKYYYDQQIVQGTSISAAYASSAAALILSAFPDTTMDELGNYLRNHATNIGNVEFSEKTGFGMLSMEDFDVSNNGYKTIYEPTAEKGDVVTMAETMSVTYYYTAKGWIYNDIVYMESCPCYISSYGGSSAGLLEEGWYRFVKSNGSYVALCDVELDTGTKARAAYKNLWNEKDGMWSWEQALYNQLDGTREGSNPTAIKTAEVDGKVVEDEAQNYRFTRCWIKMEDLAQNPETLKQSYTQKVQYYLINGRTGEAVEDANRMTEQSVVEGDNYELEVPKITGYTIEKVLINGTEHKNLESVKLEVKQENQIQLYYAQNKTIVSFKGNGGTGSMELIEVFYGETITLPLNQFQYKGATFIGWSPNGSVMALKYSDGGSYTNTEPSNNATRTLYACWDYAPTVTLRDLYFTSEELLKQKNMNTYILSFNPAKDHEDGEIIPGKTDKTLYEILTDVESQVKKAKDNWIEYQVLLRDSIGNEVRTQGRLYIVDASGVTVGVEEDNLRFISSSYVHTLAKESVWRSNLIYNRLLMRSFAGSPKETWMRSSNGWRKM